MNRCQAIENLLSFCDRLQWKLSLLRGVLECVHFYQEQGRAYSLTEKKEMVTMFVEDLFFFYDNNVFLKKCDLPTQLLLVERNNKNCPSSRFVKHQEAVSSSKTETVSSESTESIFR